LTASLPQFVARRSSFETTDHELRPTNCEPRTAKTDLRTPNCELDTELNDESALREQLLAAEMRLELGELTREQFDVFEADIIVRLREIRERKQGPAAPLSPGDYTITGIEATFEGDEHSPAR
jgi:hypothetical protein